MIDVANAITLLANYIIVPSLAYGSQLALGALGITLVYAVLRFSNFAHGEMMSFGTMIAILMVWLFQSIGISIAPLPTALIALPFSIITTIFLLLILDKFVFRYYQSQRVQPVTFMIVSVGVMFFLAGFIRFIIGTSKKNFADGERFIIKASEFKQMTGLAEGLSIRTTQAITVIATLILVTAIFWFLNKTRMGKSMRAFSDNEDLALLSGIKPERVIIVTWMLVGALAAVAGTLYGLDKGYKPFVYLQLVLPIFAAAIVGGVGNPIGAVIGGYVIAFSEAFITFAYKRFLTYLLPDEWAPDGLVQLLSTEYKFAVSFVLLVIVLLVRPTGLFRGKTL
ncbi:branched-chain amino acid ABC transporter permease [Alphaproteobacteria bacterium]|nr:branched-chain amino acid ABC transporter permease [Alphaproteobacteria bacterium]MDA9815688.1 branched-chain amino acid ABC transporter permease [Alphaproteobacteria bacterium]MDC0462115.1 branched-chain amino acid ABC transporter permease [Alphaproteobacteria bacterium]MDC3311755.1 branched-chain amino acid ABC transporter permease [Alphaproteobacteria bacterium]